MFKVDFDAVIGGKINDIGWLSLSWPDPNELDERTLEFNLTH